MIDRLMDPFLIMSGYEGLRERGRSRWIEKDKDIWIERERERDHLECENQGNALFQAALLPTIDLSFTSIHPLNNHN